MLSNLRKLLPAAVLVVPGITAAQDAQAIIDKARAMQLERWEGVNCYAVTKDVMGHPVTTYHERVEVVLEDGSTETLFIARPDMCELAGEAGNGGIAAGGSGQPRKMTPEEMEMFADGLDMTGEALSTEMDQGMNDAGLPKGFLKGLGAGADGPWVSPDPGTMMGGMAGFMRAGAEGQREMAAERQENMTTSAQEMARFREEASLVGTDSVDGRKAYHLRAMGDGQVQEMDGQEFTMTEINIWLDRKELVPLKMTMRGTLSEGGEVRPIVMENHSLDYRDVPDSKMYESYHQKMTISGVMDEKQQAELAKAQKELEKFEAEMAAMPADQRAMMESMMGGRMDMMRNMASGGGFQTETVISNIQINPGLMAQNAPAQMAPAASPAAAGGDGVLKMVQENLTALGYNTGNTDGVESTETIVAISQFQAENGMEVTGAASPQLAGILAAKANQGAGGGAAPAAPAANDAATLQAAQQACLQEKMEAAQKKQKKKRGFGRLMNAATRVAGQSGNYDLARKTSDVYSATATADDLAAAAKDLGLTEDDIEACENPL